MTPCYRCPSTATHYPRIMFRADLSSGNVATLRWLLALPVCEAHRTPFVTEVLRGAAHSPLSNLQGEIADRFKAMHGVAFDDALTDLEWLGLDHPSVYKFVHEAATARQSRPPAVQAEPITIEHVTPEQLAEIMASAPDIAIKH